MPFLSIDRDTQEMLNQNYRSPDVLPGPVPPARGVAAAPQNPNRKVSDEALDALAFRAITQGRSFNPERAYSLRVKGTLLEPEFTYRGVPDTWVSGATQPGGQPFEMIGSRIKKIEQTVRVEARMADSVLRELVTLAQSAVKRSLSEALWGSNPPNDDGETLKGFPGFVTQSQTLAFDPTLEVYGNLVKLAGLVKPSGGGQGCSLDTFITSQSVIEKLALELYGKNLLLPYSFSNLTGMVHPYVLGVPILIGRVPEPAAPAKPTTVVYGARLTGPSAIAVLCAGGDPSNHCVQVGPPTPIAGLDATGEAKTATIAVNVWGEYAAHVPEAESIALLSGVPL